MRDAGQAQAEAVAERLPTAGRPRHPLPFMGVTPYNGQPSTVRGTKRERCVCQFRFSYDRSEGAGWPLGRYSSTMRSMTEEQDELNRIRARAGLPQRGDGFVNQDTGCIMDEDVEPEMAKDILQAACASYHPRRVGSGC